MDSNTKFKTIDEYIAAYPENVQKLLEQLRSIIKKTAPEAEEIISYNMPAFKLKGIIVYFAAHKEHIGFYALPTGNEAFKKELSQYKTGKGSVQFPFEKGIPVALVKKIVKFRVKENLEKAKAKTKKLTK
ncbi:MAG: DUF1801 domain-containing protein [FCB group bacterium]|jgi:uncharacterized protein YdhG (YjbR/CyaY superfamily)